MNISENFIKRYTDKRYKHATLLRHRGTVIAFAMDDECHIYYSILNLNDSNATPIDKVNWLKNPGELVFPDEIAQVGFGGLDQTRLSIVKKNGDVVTDNSIVNAEEKDRFLSSTARLSCDAPFQVLSDGKYIYLFRQSVDSNHKNMVFKRDTDGVFVLDKNGQRIPLVDDSLLLDRYILAGTRLLPKTEVRYQRSRSRHRPQSRKDSLSARDMEGKLFFEPTQELDFVKDLKDGRFSVLLLPSQIPGQQRWQIFAHNKKTTQIDTFNIERAKDGLFNTQGTRFYTCPDHPEVFEKSPGQCPIDDSQALVPITKKTGQAKSALQFTGKGHLQIADLNLGDNGCIECWLKLDTQSDNIPTQAIIDGTIVSTDNQKEDQINTKASQYFYLEYRDKKLRFSMEDVEDSDFKVSANLRDKGEWHHVAIIWRFNNAPALQMIIDGKLVAEDKRPATTNPGFSELIIGKPRTSYKARGMFKGQMDELRLWVNPLSITEIADQKNYRLQGDETGLAGYWRFDEGNGSETRDQSTNAKHGILNADVTWIASSAPLGERPGLLHNSFSIADWDGMTDREVTSGLSAALYYQQEKGPTGYDGKSRPLRKNARVMFTMPTKGAANEKSHIAALDFAVTREGKLAQIPDKVALPLVDRTTANNDSLSELLAVIKESENKIRFLHNQLHDAGEKETLIIAEIKQLEDDLQILETKRQELKNGIAALEDQRKAYEKEQKEDSATFFGGEDFSEPLLSSLNIGEFSDNETLSKIQQAKSIKIPASRRVTLHGVDAVGKESISSTFENHVANMASVWNNHITQMDVTLQSPQDAEIANKKEELSNWEGKPDELKEKKANLEKIREDQKKIPAELKAEREKLDQLNEVAQQGIPLPLLNIDSQGLTCTGGLLGFAWSISPPQLFESSNGKLSLYFRGEKDQFFTAYYDVLTAKPEFLISEDVMLVARSASPELDSTVVTITDGNSADTCHITIEIIMLGLREVWKNVPRALDQFSRILNGEAELKDKKSRFFYDYNNLRFEGIQVSAEIKRSLLFFVITDKDQGIIKNTVSSHAPGQLAENISGKINSLQLSEPLSKDCFAGTRFWIGRQRAYLTETAVSGSVTLKHNAILLVNELPAGTPIFISATTPAQWVADRPGKALAFDGKDDYMALVDQDNVSEMLPEGDLTLEAWIKPEETTESSISGSDYSRLIHCYANGSRYDLGLNGRPTALKMDGVGDYVDLGDVLNPGNQRWTVELWFRSDHNSKQNILFNKESLYEAAINDGYFQYAFRPHWNWDGAKSFPVKTGQWYHVAVVYDGRRQRVYRNGRLVYTRTQRGGIGSNAKKLLLGARGDHSPINFFNGQIDEVRIWNTGRNQREIVTTMHRRLKGDEKHLQGYWHFNNLTAQDLSVNQQHGTLVGNPQNAFYLYAGVGDKFVASKTSIEFDHWSHVAATYNQSYALEFDRDVMAYLDCGTDQSLNVVKDLTIEIFFKVTDLDQPCGLLSKGQLDTGTQDEVPYDLQIQKDGKLRFSFEDMNHDQHSVVSSIAIKKNRFYRVAITRKHETKITEKDKKVFVDPWDDIRFYVSEFNAAEGRHVVNEAGYQRHRGPSVGSNNAIMEIGKSYAGENDPQYFSGTISEVRLWSTAREESDINIDINGQEKGLLSWWRFEENEGNIAFDSKGNNHGTRSAVRWVKNPDPLGSTFVLYNNGSPIPTKSTHPVERGGQQFTLGALRQSQAINKTTEENGEVIVTEGMIDIISEGFAGVMEEVRIWKTFRTHEQLQDNMFRKLLGEREDLLAYYAFDDEQAGQHGITKDSSFNGHDLIPGTENQQPTFVLSKAPVGNDTAQVRSALAGEKTDFHDVIHGRPGVQEYGDMQLNTEGELFGVMKRAYSIIKDDQWQLITGFKVGDLITEWIGQAQANPQLSGYIEGAPPVPSENLTFPTKTFRTYNGVSSVRLNEADNVRYVYTSSEELGLDTVFNVKATAGFKSKSSAGFGLTTSVEETNITAGVKGYFESSNSQMEDASVSIGRNTNRISEMEMIGAWEAPDAVRNPALGRRFLARNVGFALVQSDTVDIFALRLKHNNALVSYWMRPNPDIPKDWNILTFEMNPAYTEQGALDGKVGFDESGRVVTSENYPNAASYGEWSYFKPREAYSLKNRIERDDQELKNFYENHNVAQGTGAGEGAAIGAVAGGLVGGAAGAGLGALAGSAIGGALSSEASLPDEELKKLAKRNIANTYVWTASGGFFEESTQVMEARSATAGGNYSMKGGGGATVKFNTAISKVAVGFELDALFGAHWSVTTTKSLDTEESFSIDIKLNTERDIQKYNNGEPAYDKNGNPVYQTGKVDAYRFMTFYLQPDLLHFDEFTNKVVDSQWLQESSDPNAIALRQAVQAQQTAKDEDKSLPWRVMHRVTYISRILPDIAAPAAPLLEKAMKKIDLESHYQLVLRLEPFVRDKIGTEFNDAVEKAVHDHMSELIPHINEVTEFMRLYLDLPE